MFWVTPGPENSFPTCLLCVFLLSVSVMMLHVHVHVCAWNLVYCTLSVFYQSTMVSPQVQWVVYHVTYEYM